MGRQSARLYYGGKDHKDIFFRGNYHRAMYKGSKLLWMKLDGEKYVPIINSINGEYGVYIFYPESKGIEKLTSLKSRQFLIFNGTFLFTNELEFVSVDGKKYESYDHEGIEMSDAATIGGCIGYKQGIGECWFFFNNNGEIVKEIELPLVSLRYEEIKAADYFQDYYFFRRRSGSRHVLGIIRKDGYELPDVSFLNGTISYYVNVNDWHIVIIARGLYLYVYRTKDFSSWEYYDTGIKTIIENNEYEPELSLSCINDGEKYLLYVMERKGNRKRRIFLYETYDFENFTKVSLPTYITLHGIKEWSIMYIVTDEEQFWNDPPEKDLNLVNQRFDFLVPSYVTNESTIIYNNGIKMNPQSIITTQWYIDNLYLQDSENNTVLDFWEG